MTQKKSPFHTRFHAERNAEKVAFKMCDSGETVSFGELEARANQGAHAIRSVGIGIGDHIAILMENRREFLETCFAADRAGVYYTTISTHLTPDEIAYILSDCGAKMLVSSHAFKPLLEKLGPSAVHSCKVFMVGDEPVGDEGSLILQSWNTLCHTMPKTPIDDECKGLDMLYSSGTTGRPKGIKWALTGDMPGERDMLIDLLTSLYGYSADTRYLCPAPLYHAAPLRHSMVTIKAGGSVFIMPKFDVTAALSTIEREKITHSQWVPTMFVRFLKLPEAQRNVFDLSSMQVAIHAAAPCPTDVKRDMLSWWGPIIFEYYAATENNGFTSIGPDEWLKHPGSVGQAKLGTIHICDERGKEVPIGEEGEVFFENGHQFEYHNDEAKTRASRNKQGWSTLGDIGRLDEEGYLYLTDRKSFVIISGGVNIYPQEAEDVLLSHPAVMDAAVFGVPNLDFGEEVKAVVQLVPGFDASDRMQEDLIALTNSRLAKIKCPRTIEFRDQLPRSATGKLYKQQLKAEFWG